MQSANFVVPELANLIRASRVPSASTIPPCPKARKSRSQNICASPRSSPFKRDTNSIKLERLVTMSSNVYILHQDSHGTKKCNWDDKSRLLSLHTLRAWRTFLRFYVKFAHLLFRLRLIAQELPLHAEHVFHPEAQPGVESQDERHSGEPDPRAREMTEPGLQRRGFRGGVAVPGAKREHDDDHD